MTIEERLERLEGQNKRLKAGLVSLLALVVVAGVFGFTQPDRIPDLVEARAFHVVGKDGTVLVKLEDSYGDGIGVAGTVRTMNSDGQDLIQLTLVDGGGTINMMNGKGQHLVRLTSINGGGMISTSNSEGKTGVLLATTKDGGSFVAMNGKGEPMVALGSTTDGGFVVTMNDEAKPTVRIGARNGSVGVVEALDPSGVLPAGTLTPR